MVPRETVYNLKEEFLIYEDMLPRHSNWYVVVSILVQNRKAAQWKLLRSSLEVDSRTQQEPSLQSGIREKIDYLLIGFGKLTPVDTIKLDSLSHLKYEGASGIHILWWK